MRVSVTTLEEFRRYMAGLCWCKEECTCEPRLIQSIKGVFVPLPRMEAGTRFHKAIETGCGDGYDGEMFLESLQAVDGGRLAAPLADRRGVHEGKFVLDILGVRVVGKWDYLFNGVAYDWKTTDKSAAGDYTESLQWRFTLAAMPDARLFRYESFRLVPDTTPTEVRYLSPGQEFTRYPALMSECEEWVRQFLAYVTLRGLEGFIADKASNECPV